MNFLVDFINLVNCLRPGSIRERYGRAQEKANQELRSHAVLRVAQMVKTHNMHAGRTLHWLPDDSCFSWTCSLCQMEQHVDHVHDRIREADRQTWVEWHGFVNVAEMRNVNECSRVLIVVNQDHRTSLL
jgi:hypothetical protein